jgi:Flp pilus assembly protein TadG
MVHMAIAMVALMAFSALVIDYGIFWVARRQAQNAADAGALAGAISLAFEDSANFTSSGGALTSAQAAARMNLVWGLQPSVILTDDSTSDVQVVTCPDGTVNNCVKADVYRTGARGNALPTFFARLVNVNTQDVRASAIAEAVSANTSDCLKPWAVADRWDEVDASPGTPGGIQNPNWDPDWHSGSTFDTSTGDLYLPPTSSSPGTGYRVYDSSGQLCCDYGLLLRLKQDTANAMWYQEINFPGESNSSALYRAHIAGCFTATVGQTVNVKPGVSHGPTDHGVDDLIAQDPDAFWYNPNPDPSKPWLDTYNPRNVPVPSGLDQRCPQGCVYSPDTGINASPRIGAVPVMSPAELMVCSNCDITVRNILGFFVDRPAQGNGNNQEVWGRLVKIPGRFVSTGTPVDQAAAALKQIVLVR